MCVNIPCNSLSVHSNDIQKYRKMHNLSYDFTSTVRRHVLKISLFRFINFFKLYLLFIVAKYTKLKKPKPWSSKIFFNGNDKTKHFWRKCMFCTCLHNITYYFLCMCVFECTFWRKNIFCLSLYYPFDTVPHTSTIIACGIAQYNTKKIIQVT